MFDLFTKPQCKKMSKQAEAELGQAQPKLRLKLEDFD